MVRPYNESSQCESKTDKLDKKGTKTGGLYGLLELGALVATNCVLESRSRPREDKLVTPLVQNQNVPLISVSSRFML